MNDSDISKAILEQLISIEAVLIERYHSEKNKILEIPPDVIKFFMTSSDMELPKGMSIEKAFKTESDMYLTVKISMGGKQ